MKAYMGLNCKPGKCNEVMKNLSNLNVDQENMFLLFGPIDVLIMFNNLADVGEFVQKWVKPIRMLGAEGDLIKKTNSLIVISEETGPSEKPATFLFLNTTPQSTEDVRAKLLALPEVIFADYVLGAFDLICGLKAEDHESLQMSVIHIQQITGVVDTVTSIVA